MSEWQPIETAPTNERIVLWCSNEWRNFETTKMEPKGPVFGQVYGYDDGHRSARGEGLTGDWDYSHWMPLPEAP